MHPNNELIRITCWNKALIFDKDNPLDGKSSEHKCCPANRN
jgi:hypothetical protein